MRIGILGATGMLGHHAARAVLDMGHKLVVLHRAGASLDRLADLEFDRRVADLDQPDSLRQAFDDLDGVIHAAAYYPTLPRPWREDLAVAERQMSGFLDAVAASAVARAVYVGGSIAIPRRSDGAPADETGVLDRPPSSHNPYVQCKWRMDQMARNAGAEGVPVSIAIPSMTFGEYDWGPSTGQLLVGIANGTLTRYVRGRRNVVYAGDAGHGIARVLESGLSGQRYLLLGHNTDMDHLVEEMARIAEVPCPRPVPLAAARMISAIQAARFRWMNGPPPVISSTAIAVMSAGQHLTSSRSSSELGYRAELGLAETLQRAYDWFREMGMIRS